MLGDARAEVPLDRFIESIVPLRLCIRARLCAALGVAAHAKTLSCSDGLGGRGQSLAMGEVGRAAAPLAAAGFGGGMTVGGG